MGISTLKTTAFFLFLVTVRTCPDINQYQTENPDWSELTVSPSMAFMFIMKSLGFSALRLIYVPDTEPVLNL